MLPPHVIDPTHVRAPLDAPGAAIDALVFIAGLLLALRRPSGAVALFVATVPFDVSRDVGPTTLTTGKVALVGAIVGLVLRRARLRALRGPAVRAIGLTGCAVAAATALTIAVAALKAPALRETFKILEYVIAFAATAICSREDADQRPARYAFAAITALVSLLALAEEVAGAPSGIWFAGVAIPRIAGPLEGPNQLAGFLGIGLAVVASWLLAERRALPERLALGLGAAALVLTISRAGCAGGLLGLALAFALSPARGRRAAAWIAAGGAVAGLGVLGAWGYAATHSLAGLGLLGRFSTFAEVPQPGSVGDRSQLWRAALVLWRRRPLLGVGAGNFEFDLASAGYPGIRTHANSLYLQALAEGGVVLFAATAALTAVSIARFRRGPFHEPFVVAALAASAGLAFHQIFDDMTFFPKVGAWWWILLALGAARADAARAGERP